MTSQLLNSSILLELDKINARFLSKKSENSGIGPYTGTSGECILMFLNYLNTEDDRFQEKLNDLLNETFQFVGEQANFSNFSFATGIPGWAWTIQYLTEKDIIDPEDTDELLTSISDGLNSTMITYIESGNFDQLHGAIGIGNFLLKRGENVKVEKLIMHLDRIKIEDGDEIKWKKKSHNFDNVFSYDFGLAHGIAGILQFLSSCYKKDVSKDKCLYLMKGAIKFLINNIQDFEKVGSYFPNSLHCDAYHSGANKQERSRLAWCYGDLGIWYTLYDVAILLKNNKLEKQAIDGLLKNTERENYDDSIVVDAGFCHGSSGVAYIFYKMWLKTSLISFKDAADYWFQKTLDYGSKETYLYLKGNFEERFMQQSNELLEGDCGVAITYLCYLNPELIDWDECMLLS